MTVLDASALLAFLQGEPGVDTVRDLLGGDTRCGAANWAETAQKIRRRGGDWFLASALLDNWGLSVEPVTQADAEWAAARWRRSENLSLGDRLCLALGERLGAEIWTADREWEGLDRVRLIR